MKTAQNTWPSHACVFFCLTLMILSIISVSVVQAYDSDPVDSDLAGRSEFKARFQNHFKNDPVFAPFLEVVKKPLGLDIARLRLEKMIQEERQNPKSNNLPELHAFLGMVFDKMAGGFSEEMDSVQSHYLNQAKTNYQRSIERWKNHNSETVLLFTVIEVFYYTARDKGSGEAIEWLQETLKRDNLSEAGMLAELLHRVTDITKKQIEAPQIGVKLLPGYYFLLMSKKYFTRKFTESNSEQLKDIDAEIERIETAYGEKFREQMEIYHDDHRVPNQNTWMELVIVLLMWVLTPLLLFLIVKLTRPLMEREEEPYLLWTLDSTDTDGEPADQSGCFKRTFSVYENEPLAKYFLANTNIPAPAIAAASSVLGFVTHVLLNDVEGTLNQSPHVKLTYWACVADPINWAVLVPLFFIFVRSLYQFIPYSLNYLYENLLTPKLKNGRAVPKKEIVEIIARYGRYINFPKRCPILAVSSFLLSAIGFIHLGQNLSIYGMAVCDNTFFIWMMTGIKQTFGIHLHEAPTFLGWYIIFSLTVLVYVILNSLIIILVTILLFRHLFKDYKSEIFVNPFHIDRCGGMSFAGSLALRMIAVISTAASMGFGLMLRDIYIAEQPVQLYQQLAIPGYLIILPIIFFVPIFNARKILIDFRSRYLRHINRVSKGLLSELYGLQKGEGDEPVSLSDTYNAYYEFAEKVDKVNKIATQYLPAWPLNIQTLGGFLSAFVLPLLIPLLLEGLIK